MTKPTLNVSLNYAELSSIMDDIADMLRIAMSADENAFLVAFEDKIEPLFDQAHLMETATKLYEDDNIILWEHPIKGDEAPVMAYLKEKQYFQEDTGEWDADPHTAMMIEEMMLNTPG
jgi:hypothetical protein